MQALTWHGRYDIRCESVPDPYIEAPTDCVVKVTACAICGSDLHLAGGFVPRMERGDVLGHECVGEVVEVGREVANLTIGDRVVVPFHISCGACRMCRMNLFSACERTNPNGKEQAAIYGYPLAGIFGYSHITGGFRGMQAQYVRVPMADVGPVKLPDSVDDEHALFLSDVFPTGWMAAENCEPKPTDRVVVFGCGPVGLFAIKSLRLMNVEHIVALDLVPERLALARGAGATTLDISEGEIQDRIMAATDGQGADAVIDAVGLEAHGSGSLVERVASAVQSKVTAGERTYALNHAIVACRPGGVLSVPGVYAGPIGPVMMGAIMQKGLVVRSGQTHMHRYMRPLLERIEKGEIDPTFLITHRSADLADGPQLYKTFRDKAEGCVKVVIRPNG